MIPRSECKDRRLYRIRSRNLDLGVYCAETGGFVGLREKFGAIYPFAEYHWDNGPPFGTVMPEAELPDSLPLEIADTERLGTICSACGQAAAYVEWPEGGQREVVLSSGKKVTVRGEWKHVGGDAPRTGCAKVAPTSVPNTPLHEWLEGMEAKYRRPGQ